MITFNVDSIDHESNHFCFFCLANSCAIEYLVVPEKKAVVFTIKTPAPSALIAECLSRLGKMLEGIGRVNFHSSTAHYGCLRLYVCVFARCAAW